MRYGWYGYEFPSELTGRRRHEANLCQERLYMVMDSQRSTRCDGPGFGEGANNYC